MECNLSFVESVTEAWDRLDTKYASPTNVSTQLMLSPTLCQV